jgi:DUF1680 family protein
MLKMFSLASSLAVLLAAGTLLAAEKGGHGWNLPGAAEVQLGGALGEAYERGVARLAEDPYRSVVYLRSDLTFEIERSFTNYSGDISGRFLEIATLTSPAGTRSPQTLADLLQTVTDYQLPDGHFGRPIDWSTPIDDPSINQDAGKAIRTPVFWGHSRLLVGLLEAYAAYQEPKFLKAACGIGDFYITTANIYLNPDNEALFKSTGTYSAGYVTDYFPAIEGLVRLYQVTHEERYLRQAERMAEFFKRFDQLPIEHSHGNLITYHGLLLLYETTGNQELLQRTLDRWKAAMEGGFVWAIGGVGERFNLASGCDEGCSEADWLRLNLDLWRITGETRFLDAAERLISNHFAMNRTANGGYGHHFFVCDGEGPLLMKTDFMEAVWCCTFHGLLGMHTLKSYVAVGSDRGAFINFPFDVVAPVQTGKGLWNVTVRRLPDADNAVACAVRIDSREAAAEAPPVFLRRPNWAESVKVCDAKGQAVEAACDAGYLRLPAKPGAEGELTVTFGFAPRVENRRMQRLAVDPSQITRHAGVVLGAGPRVFLANADQPRPVVVATVDKDGRLQLPASEAGIRKLATVASIDASEAQVREALAKPGTLELASWEGIHPDRGAALVFDLIAVPAEK